MCIREVVFTLLSMRFINYLASKLQEDAPWLFCVLSTPHRVVATMADAHSLWEVYPKLSLIVRILA